MSRDCPPLAPGDGAAKAMRLLRERGLPAAVVVEQGRVVGIVGEEDLLRHAAPPWAPVEPERVRTTPVGALMRPVQVTLSEDEPLYRAVEMFTQGNYSILPVVDAQGNYASVITRSDVMTGLFAASIPRSIGGLATPLGVYLTTGVVRAGPGDLGLMLAGAALSIIFALAQLLVNLLAWAVESNFPGLPLLSARLAHDGTNFYLLFPWQAPATAAMFLLDIALFFALLRFSPLSALHAAEHMVVHAIEHGEELTPDRVERMPRVHPRCGTNMMAVLFVLIVGAQVITGLATSLPLATSNMAAFWSMGAVLLIALAARKRLGPLLQALATTRQPPRRFLVHAIAVGKDLLARFQKNPSAPRWGIARVWNMGLLQAAAGFIAMAYLIRFVSERFNLGLLP